MKTNEQTNDRKNEQHTSAQIRVGIVAFFVRKLVRIFVFLFPCYLGPESVSVYVRAPHLTNRAFSGADCLLSLLMLFVIAKACVNN